MAAGTDLATTNTTGSQLASAGSATKAFLLAHPVSVAVVGGIILGAASYWFVSKYWKNKKEEAAAT